MTRSDREDQGNATRLLRNRLPKLARPSRCTPQRPLRARSSRRNKIRSPSLQLNPSPSPKARQKLSRSKLLPSLASPKLLPHRRSRASHLRKRASLSLKSQLRSQRPLSRRVPRRRKGHHRQSRLQKAQPSSQHLQRSRLPRQQRIKRDLDPQ